ncbi:hypothetical protein AC623_10480 [Bacillus sp. FJAT-27231]|uniref:hypothetical protein n=1 Tax=Bacillus sp. FJAT-27231 TaxID=1679168 RepID=UPI0006715AC1|nr:hypothetical protein [Bacillus sp. FJAT-27231]KMY54302.1 hypothetical protein AC623_10480 [Bacillus sp. FJAT-27231]
MKKIRQIGFLLLAFVCMLAGCTETNTTSTAKERKPGTVFEVDGQTLYGEEGKFGMIKLNGESGEPAFAVGQGRHYQLYFLADAEKVNGKLYNMTALHQETGKKVKLYEAVIENAQSGAKFVLDQSGKWKINVTVDKEPYASFVITAE